MQPGVKKVHIKVYSDPEITGMIKRLLRMTAHKREADHCMDWIFYSFTAHKKRSDVAEYLRVSEREITESIKLLDELDDDFLQRLENETNYQKRGRPRKNSVRISSKPQTWEQIQSGVDSFSTLSTDD
ncbi:MAG: hypothetical protein AAGA30_00875 [Planctomycetota bacterium]